MAGTAATAASVYSPGPPVAAYMPPGQCVFGPDWAPAPLVSKVSVSKDTRLFTFKLKDPKKPLGLSTCACLLMKGVDGPHDAEGNPVVRPYTPVSTNKMLGQFELMVKIYPEGKITQHLDRLEIGQSVDFKHIDKNVKIQYPFKSDVGIIAGGTGITPMIQALHCILGSEADASRVTLLYGSKTVEDILAKETLDQWESSHGKRLSVTHVLSHEPLGSAWAGERGFVTKELIQAKLPPPSSSDCAVFVCGPPAMYEALCGPRDQAELGGLLAALGYKAEQVFKF